jgi:hypothetical protein
LRRHVIAAARSRDQVRSARGAALDEFQLCEAVILAQGVMHQRFAYGYDAPFRYNDSLGYHYLAGFVGLPLVTVDYRFPCRRVSSVSAAR